MALKSLKKTLVYTSELSKNLIESMIDDESQFSKTKASAIMENYILGGLITDNKQISFWIQGIYTGEWSTGRVLSSIFEFNSAGVNWQSCHLNLLPFIEFAIDEQKYCDKAPVNEDLLYHFYDQLSSISSKFKTLEDKANDYNDAVRYAEAQKTISYLIEDTKSHPQGIVYINFYRLIKEYWEELKDWSIPFRMLTDLADIQNGWRNTFESRYILTKLLRDLEKEWPLD